MYMSTATATATTTTTIVQYTPGFLGMLEALYSSARFGHIPKCVMGVVVMLRSQHSLKLLLESRSQNRAVTCDNENC